MPFALILFLGLLQGATELFPVSSLGHAVVVPAIFHLNVNAASDSFVPFLTLLHLGTAAALFYIYRHDWIRIIAAFFRAAIRGRITNDTERLSMLLLAGTVPTALVGAVLETPVKRLFAKPALAAGFLILNGVVLLGAEMLRRRREQALAVTDRQGQEEAFAAAPNLSFVQAALIGFSQVAAFLPGISRSGVTMATGLACGLRHQEALRFGFLLATPVIGGAGVLEIPQLLGSGAPLGEYALGALLAAAAAFASAKFLIRYFRVGRLDPFAGYCVALGLAGLVAAH